MTRLQPDPKPEHFCADHDWAHLLPGDPRMATCLCTFDRDLEERAREVWRAAPAPQLAGDWSLRFGGATVGVDDHGAVSYVAIDEPPFESEIVRDLIEYLPMAARAYLGQFHIEPATYTGKMHYTQYVAKTMNARLHGLRRGH